MAFQARVFAWLSIAMMITALVGALVVLALGPQAAGWSGVVAGFELLTAGVWPAVDRRLRRELDSTPGA